MPLPSDYKLPTLALLLLIVLPSLDFERLRASFLSPLFPPYKESGLALKPHYCLLPLRHRVQKPYRLCAHRVLEYYPPPPFARIPFPLPTPNMAAERSDEKGVVDSSTEEQRSSLELVNASGHRQELERNYSLLSICALAITTGNTWIAQGGSVATALYNGGPSGVIYEFIAVSVCYWMVAASIAELASGMPSAGGGMLIIITLPG